MRVSLLVVCFVLGSLANAQDEASNYTIADHWQLMEKALRTNLDMIMKQATPVIMRMLYQEPISPGCMADLLRVTRGLKKLEPWAIGLIDSSGKIPEGLTSGTLSALGSFDQCMEIRATHSRTGVELFQGQYCAVNIKPHLPPKPKFYHMGEILPELRNLSQMSPGIELAAKFAHFFYFLSMKIGLCVPSTCTIEDVRNVAKGLGKNFHVTTEVPKCYIDGPKEFKIHHLCIIAVFIFVGIIVAIGSVLEIFLPSHYYDKYFVVRILQCFSFPTNMRKLFNTNIPSSDLAPIHGMRFLTITWIIVGHTYLNINYQAFRGLQYISKFSDDFAFQIVLNATVSVDTFFFISGFLLCYLVSLKLLNKNLPVNIPQLLFHRFWRLTPTYIAVIGGALLTPLMGRGPIWDETTSFISTNCGKNWWTNLLYINNFVNPTEQCIFETWYLASDTQLFILALFILFFIKRYPRPGVAIILLLIFLSIFSVALITFLNKFPPTMLFVHPDPIQRVEYMSSLYYKPYPHMGSYCVGMLLGLYMAKFPNVKIKSKLIIALGWIFSATSCLAVLFGVYDWNKGAIPNPVSALTYASLHRVVWSLGIAWVTFACIRGHGGYANSILSWRGFIPLSRLTFLAFLLHPIIQFVFIGNLRAQLQSGHMMAVWGFFGYFCTTLGISTIFSIIFESSSLSLEKLLFLNKEKEINEKPIEKLPVTTIYACNNDLETNSKPICNGDNIDNGYVIRL